MSYQVSIPEIVKSILQKLLDNGYEAYIVGGSVRDQIIGRIVHDYDITTSALPNQIKAVFKKYKVMSFGEKHGTISLYIKKQMYEITTFRTEGKYTDGRRPDEVFFVNDLRSDLARRDFTINAMAADINGMIIDPFNGKKDIQNKLIRAVRDPNERFTEDSLRILRAFRFALRYEFEIEKNTSNAIISQNYLIDEHEISAERIATEMKEIIIYGATAIRLLEKYGTLQLLFPNITQYEYSNTIDYLDRIKSPNMELNYAILFHKTLMRDKSVFKKYLSNLTGYGNYAKQYIELISSKIIPLDIIKNTGKIRLIIWLEKTLNKIYKKNSFNMQKYIDDIVQIASIIHKIHISDKFTDELHQSFNLFTSKLVVDGDDAKKLGFRGKNISHIIRIWRLLFYQNKLLQKEDYYKIIEDSINNRDIDSIKNKLTIIEMDNEDKKVVYSELDRCVIAFS